jgi:hypothetical protein
VKNLDRQTQWLCTLELPGGTAYQGQGSTQPDALAAAQKRAKRDGHTQYLTMKYTQVAGRVES